MGAEGYAAADVLGLAGDAELTPASARSDDDLLCGDDLTEVGVQLLEPLHQLDALYLTIVQEGDGVDLGVLA